MGLAIFEDLREDTYVCRYEPADLGRSAASTSWRRKAPTAASILAPLAAGYCAVHREALLLEGEERPGTARAMALLINDAVNLGLLARGARLRSR